MLENWSLKPSLCCIKRTKTKKPQTKTRVQIQLSCNLAERKLKVKFDKFIDSYFPFRILSFAVEFCCGMRFSNTFTKYIALRPGVKVQTSKCSFSLNLGFSIFCYCPCLCRTVPSLAYLFELVYRK